MEVKKIKNIVLKNIKLRRHYSEMYLCIPIKILKKYPIYMVADVKIENIEQREKRGK